ncbi:HEAT repeat domain-containing protein [bacterium]|nr:HEAT repeat domain-containing protein [bacterium]
MLKVLFLLVVFCTSSLFAQSVSVLDDKVKLNDDEFVQSIVKADTIVAGRYIQGGKTKAKVLVEKAYVGDVSGEIEITGIDGEKLRRRYKRDDYKKADLYVFILKKDTKTYKLLPNSITIPLAKDNTKANFSFNTPHLMNFWLPFDEKLFEVAVKGIREHADKMQNESTQNAFSKLIDGYVAKKDTTSLRESLAVAKLAQLKFDEEHYDNLTAGKDTLSCLAIKFSGEIMGGIYFDHNVLPKAETLSADNQTAFGYAAMSIYSKQSVPVIGRMLNKISLYSPASSECFPDMKPASNKEVFVRALIEIDSPETIGLLATQLESGDANWLSRVLAIIAEYDGADLVELVLKAATNERLSERKLEFSNYFNKVKSKSVAETLVSLFGKSGDSYWKKTILSVVGTYQFAESLPFLIQVLNEDSKEEIRTTAAMSIGQVGNAGGAKPLYEFIVREKSILAKSIGIQSLAKIGDKSVQDYLKKLVSDEADPKVREEAANAIEDNLFILRYGKEKD